MKAKSTFWISLLIGTVAIGVAVIWHFRAHMVNDAEDRRRWLREVDKENAQSGFIKDSNGDLIYVGTTNGQKITN
jgi:hypothetical protein